MQRRHAQVAGLILVGLVFAGVAGATLAAEADRPAKPAEPASAKPGSEEPWQPAGVAGILPIGSWRKPQPPVSAASAEDVAAWRKLKFGLFVHWGPVSVRGTEIGWSRGGYRRGLPWNWNILSGQVPVEVYDNLYKKFNPTRFDAREWVQIAKDAGTKYLVFTTKHHDGFSNYDTKLSDYKITSPESPYGRDIVRQLADACHEGGILWGVYYSQVDWRHPDYMNSIDGHRRYLKFLHGQMRELLTNYGRVSMIFFDGLSGDAKDWDGVNLVNMCRELQPGVMINDRAGVPADYSTPEQEIGQMDTKRPWETCMTIGTQWSWKPNDRIKSFKECIQTLVRVVGGDGNLLFNVGPMPDGRIEPRQADRLREMGRWLAKYGESIYDTRGGPFRTGQWGAATCRDRTIYVHVLDGGKTPITLPPIDRKIVSHRVLTGGEATVEQTDKAVTITLAADARNDVDTIVALELDGPAWSRGRACSTPCGRHERRSLSVNTPFTSSPPGSATPRRLR